MPVPLDAVWTTLSDGHQYSDWVVGTRRIRDVDEGFPAKGTRLHYSVGHGPLQHHGHTEVLDVDEGHRLVMEAHAWPVGTARIDLTLAPAGGGTRVRIDERPGRGAAVWLHNPATDLFLKLRNVEALRRLDRLARRQALRGGA